MKRMKEFRKLFWMFRLKIYLWIKHKCGIREGQVAPKWFWPMKILFFPADALFYFAGKQRMCWDDLFSGRVYLNGISISIETFDQLRRAMGNGMPIMFSKQKSDGTYDLIYCDANIKFIMETAGSDHAWYIKKSDNGGVFFEEARPKVMTFSPRTEVTIWERT